MEMIPLHERAESEMVGGGEGLSKVGSLDQELREERWKSG